jgi:hypothetical protein
MAAAGWVYIRYLLPRIYTYVCMTWGGGCWNEEIHELKSKKGEKEDECELKKKK